MKITITTGPFYALPPAPCGAVEYIWHGLSQEFARRGHEVTFVSRSWPGLAPDERVDGVRHLRASGAKRAGRLAFDVPKDLYYSTRIFPLLPEADILVTNSVCLPVLAGFMGRRRGAIVVSVARWPKNQMWLYSRADRLAAVSNAVGEQIIAQTPAAAPRVRVVPNPIDTKVFRPPAEGRDGRSSRTILYTGRVHPEKGLHVLVDAFARMAPRHPGLTLRIVGPQTVLSGGGGGDYLRQLRERAGSLPVVFDGPIYERPALAAALQQADYYCYPSLAEKGESFGVAPLEAMATGLPTVVSDLSCFRDFVEDGASALVFDHRAADPAGELASALERLVADPDLTRRVGERGAEVAQGFSYEAVAELYLRDFEELVAGRSPARAQEQRA